MRSVNKLKYEIYRQRRSGLASIDGDALQRTATFFGLINKLEFERHFGLIDLTPRLKSEFLASESFLIGEEDHRQWTGMTGIVARFPVLRNSSVTTGLEYALVRELVADEKELLERGTEGQTGDTRSVVLGVQFNNRSDYLGFELITQIGLLVDRTSREVVEITEKSMRIVICQLGCGIKPHGPRPRQRIRSDKGAGVVLAAVDTISIAGEGISSVASAKFQS